MRERRVNRQKRESFETIRADLVRRLERVCDHLPKDELETLTARMTRIRLKYEPFVGTPGWK